VSSLFCPAIGHCPLTASPPLGHGPGWGFHVASGVAAGQVKDRRLMPVNQSVGQLPRAGRIAPLTGAAALLTRKAITAAMDSGLTACASMSVGTRARLAGVSMSYGATAFTRIPCGCSSASRIRVR
jgi:hypothetical protein